MTPSPGKYQFTGVIGTGASGTVHMAYHHDLGRYVAIKELSPSLAQQPGFLERFRAEAQIMAQLESPNCVKVYEFYEADGRAFLVEELIEGSSLRKVVNHAGTLNAEQSMGVLKGALSGLGYAHALGLVHRDVKPENILVDTAGVSKLADFGQAVFTGIGPGAAGGISPGTPAYMSPEAVRGAPLDARSDVYSAGAMVFELLTGRPPFVADSPLATMRMQMEAPIPDPRELNPSIPDDVAFMVGQTLAKDPAQRQQSASEFFNQLNAAAVAGYGADWESRASIKPLVAATVAAAAAGLAAAPVLAADAGGAASGAAQVGQANVGAADAQGPPSPELVQKVATAVNPPKVRLARLVLSGIVGAGLVLGGMFYGANHGVLPTSLAAGTQKWPVVGAGAEGPPTGSGGGGPGGSNTPKVTAAGTGGNGASTVVVLDVSGSMDSPALIPPGFPKAQELKDVTDAVSSVLEQWQGGKKLPAGALINGAASLTRLVQLQQELQAYEQANGIDPKSTSKLAVMKASADALADRLSVETKVAGANNKLGAITFSTTAAQLAPLAGNPAGLKPQIDALQTDGSTDIGDGLQQAVQMLNGQQAPAIVLLTDGWNNEAMTNDQIINGPVAAAAAKGIPICTIGLGISPNDVDQLLLTTIAGNTHASYYFVGDGVSLADTMLECHGRVSGQPVADFHGKVTQGQTVDVPAFQVPSGKRRLDAAVTWLGSDLDLQLVNSSGQTVKLDQTNSIHRKGLITTTIANPPGGSWSARVVGTNVSNPNGEDFFVNVATDGTSPDQHFSTLSASQAKASGALGQVREIIRLVLVIAAIAGGIAIVLLGIRGILRRMHGRRLAKKGEKLKGKFLVPFLLYTVAILALIAVPIAFGADYLWNTPLISIPKP
ncbi:MAG TPA: serine/threonine-protein kinase [Candidatus Dormibacteraeota bacterium]|nr:serine/threonine-protein kinase [Candidatus Dormibacteraeota bacterium]